MPYICHVTLKSNDTWHLKFSTLGKLRPLVILSPAIAEPIVKSNRSKQDVLQYLFDYVRFTGKSQRNILGFPARGY
jgi:hypothetical protein